jgi:hypothetical protein
VKRCTHLYTVTWSTSTPRSMSSSSTSRYDSPKRKYQRTATTITSGGKRKPAKADRAAGAGRGRQDLMPGVLLFGCGHSQCNSAGCCAGGQRPVRRRAADSGCPTHLPHRRRASESVPHNGHLQWLRWRGRVAVVSSSRASGPVGGHPDQDGSGQADVQCGWCPPGVATSPLGRTVAEPAADTSDRSAAAVRGCCPRFRTPRTARRSPSWPASGGDRYRNRWPGRRPLVGCRQRW